MKTTLTIEQSAELIKHGVSRKQATSSVWSPSENAYIYPIFTVGNILSLLPKEVGKIHSLRIYADNTGWDVTYGTYHEGYEPKYLASGKELINVLYTALLWCIDNNYIKLD